MPFIHSLLGFDFLRDREMHFEPFTTPGDMKQLTLQSGSEPTSETRHALRAGTRLTSRRRPPRETRPLAGAWGRGGGGARGHLCAGRPSAHVVRRPRPSLCGAALPPARQWGLRSGLRAMERWVRPQLWLWLLFLLLPPVPGRQKESGGLRAGQRLPLGLRVGSGP